MFVSHLRTSVIALVAFTVITGIVYPLLVTGVAQLLFPEQANGSLIVKDGRVLGSALIGQPFSDPRYFWGRLSATSPYPYNAGASSGSNYGPLNPALLDATLKRSQQFRRADSLNILPIPVDLVTASASGLDPHISIEAAQYQISRVARVRGINRETLRSLVEENTEGRQWGFLGEPRVNVLKLNLALDAMKPLSEVK
jgi:K+-transporting ATPase ATPase C chain